MRIDWLPSAIRQCSQRFSAWRILQLRERRRPRTGIPRLEVLEERVVPVLGINTPPVALVDTYIVNQDSVLNGDPGVLANDLDVDGDTLHAVLVTGPTNGTLDLNNDGTFTYTPDPGFLGTDTFRYRANDGTVNSLAAALVTLIVNPLANRPPVANDDFFTVTEDSPLNLSGGTALSGVLANDTDEDFPLLLELLGAGDLVLTAQQVTSPQHGTLTFLPSGTFIYTPEANYSGPDTFTYQATDGLSMSNIATVTINVTSVNDAPVSVGDSYATNEDTPLSVAAPGVLANDSDVDGNPLSAEIVTQPSHGTVTLNSNGSFLYTPTANYRGSDSFTYRASDGTTFGNTSTVSLVINSVSDSPVAVNDAYLTTEDGSLSVLAATGVLANDTDGDEDSLTASLVVNPQHGALTLSSTGAFVYTPHPNFSGVDTFTYQASDGGSSSNIATVTITVNGVNDAPVATSDSFATNEDQAMVVAAPGVLLNDSDIDGGTLTATVVALPTHGTLTLNSNGSFTYTPTGNYSGPDSFTYKANDGTADSATTTVNLTVNSVNDAPVAVNDAYNVNEDSSLSVAAGLGILNNDTDVEANPLTAIIVTQPQHGTLRLQSNGAFLYTPSANYNGQDSFTYRVSDSVTLSNTATVTLTVIPVNDVPVAASNLYATVVDTQLVVNAVNGVLANDSDIDGPSLSAVLVSTTQFGNLVLSADGSFTYTPDSLFQGSDSFTYQASDGTNLSSTTLVTITVSGTSNSVPVAFNDEFQVQEDVVLDLSTGTALDGVLTNDTDTDFPVQPALHLTASLVSTPQHGTLILNSNGTFSYTPDSNYVGTDTFTYIASDSTSSSNIATVTLNVSAVNDAPVTVDDTEVTTEDTLLVVETPGLLANDSDVDSVGVTAVLVVGPAHGELELSADGSFTYLPDPNYSGPDSFTYRATDGSQLGNVATVELNVLGVNDAPVVLPETYHTNEDTPLAVLAAPGVLQNDSDPDQDSLTAAIVVLPSHGALSFSSDGAFVYTPAADFTGTDTFSYQVSDGQSMSSVAVVTVVVDPTNDGPETSVDGYSVAGGSLTVNAGAGVLANDTDPDDDALTAILVDGPLNGDVTLNTDGSFVYTPHNGFTGFDSFTYRANDGTALSSVTTVVVEVTAVANRAPVANSDAYSVTEDTFFATLLSNGVLFNDTDADGNTLTATLVGGPVHGILEFSPNGTFSYTPQANYVGQDSFTYQVGDGALNSGLATVVLTITAVNDVPVATSDSFSVHQNQSLAVAAPGVLQNDADADANALTMILVTSPAHGELTWSADGAFTYTPDANYFGADSFTYKVNDGTADSNTATVNLSVSGSNAIPVSVADAYTAVEDDTLSIAAALGVLSNDTDADSQTLTASIMTQPAHGTVTLAADGGLIYIPEANFVGVDAFSYAASDGTATGTAVVVTITVQNAPEAPHVATSQGARAVKGSRKSLVDTAVTIADPDSSAFNGGQLNMMIQSGAGTNDSLQFGRSGARRGSVNVKGNILRVGMLEVGTVTGGLRGAPIHVTFNSNATLARVNSVVQSIIFRGTPRQAGVRVISTQVMDDTGLMSNIGTKSINVN